MNQNEFDDGVQRIAQEIIANTRNERSDQVFCACIQAAISLAQENNQDKFGINQLRKSADLWEKELANATN